jgi:PTS system D-glucosamine-specific IIC component
MYKAAKPEKKEAVAGLLLSAAVTSMLTGITEPLEFTFLFVAPLLYVIHCVFAGLAYMLMHICGVGVGMTFSGGLIDMFLFGIMQGNAKTNWIWIVIVGIGYFIVYYFLFYFLITKMDLKTPGRDDSEEVKLYRRSDVDARKKGAANSTAAAEEDALSAAICRGLGGKKNISDVDCCATRLRCTVNKSELVDDSLLKSTGASGVVHKGNGVQIIYGPRVTVVKSNLEDYLETAPDEEYTPDTEVKVDKEKTEEKIGGKVVKTDIIYSPVDGMAADLSETPDEAFAGRMMGDGAMVLPEEATVYAPEDGEVSFVFETKHAIGFETVSGIGMLLHMGIDTVNLNGEGFEVFVKNGDQVKKGDPLMKLDLEFLKSHAPSLASPVLCTELSDHQKIRLLKTGKIKAGEELFAVDTYEE